MGRNKFSIRKSWLENLIKIMQHLLLMFCMLKKKKYIPLMFQNINRKKQLVLLMIPNGEVWHDLAVKKLSALLKVITSKLKGDFYCLIDFISLEQKTNLNRIKQYVKIKDFVV